METPTLENVPIILYIFLADQYFNRLDDLHIFFLYRDKMYGIFVFGHIIRLFNVTGTSHKQDGQIEYYFICTPIFLFLI